MTNPPVESLLAQRLTRPESVDVATLRAEYQVAVDFIKVLTDIRFRCLAFVTATAAVANALLPGTGWPGLGRARHEIPRRRLFGKLLVREG